MKTVTAKELQLNQSSIMGEVARGEHVTVTFHGKPWVVLEPAQSVKPKPGSWEAFINSLQYVMPHDAVDLPERPDWKKLRHEMIEHKHGLQDENS